MNLAGNSLAWDSLRSKILLRPSWVPAWCRDLMLQAVVTIAAGAGLILPRISIRNESDISKIHTGVLKNMAYVFDTRHFIDSISLSCPELKLFSSLDDFKGTNNWNNPVLLNPNAALPKVGFEKPELWGKFFWGWWYTDIAEQHNFAGIMKKGPVFVKLMRSHLTWPILSDGEAFSTQFGRILKLRADARGLATNVLMNLVQEYGLGVDIESLIFENAFWGVHLRAEKDALDGLPVAEKSKLYPTYGMRSKLYLDHMMRERNKVNTRLVFVASGDPDQVAKFWKDAKVANLTMISKLNSLTWDQQALVDLMVLTKAGEFLGVGRSGFDWTIVGRRQSLKVEILFDLLNNIYN
ncbi:hypothetical protein BDZ45DRAFT_783552 [Acephala macrosclerotiorum]|nr:hypothetical protein BDZ45DRAFT_783552 [Acephala macrosclerotiorum]